VCSFRKTNAFSETKNAFEAPGQQTDHCIRNAGRLIRGSSLAGQDLAENGEAEKFNQIDFI
jgi:hypothetical protein